MNISFSFGIIRQLALMYVVDNLPSEDKRLHRHALRVASLGLSTEVLIRGRTEHRVFYQRILLLYRYALKKDALTEEGLFKLESFLLEFNARIREITQ